MRNTQGNDWWSIENEFNMNRIESFAEWRAKCELALRGQWAIVPDLRCKTRLLKMPGDRNIDISQPVAII